MKRKRISNEQWKAWLAKLGLTVEEVVRAV